MSEVPSWLNEENISTATKVAQNPAARNAAKQLATNSPPPPPPPKAPAKTPAYTPPGDVEHGAHQAAAGPDPSSEFIIEEATLKQMQNWHLALRCAYMIAAIAMATIAGVSLQNQTDLGLVFFALYVMFFSAVICCFEFNLHMAARAIAINFGFLYSLPGRWVFLLFVGFMSFSLGTWGIVAMCVLYLVGIFHAYVMWKFPRFEEYLRKKHYYEGKFANQNK